ncbi:MAG: hypothetical protein FD170_2001 [Bacteroidetes bacterium]|nr:MAG: hypothetical protein FD170_2001 [Bacteroidota bacterium]
MKLIFFGADAPWSELEKTGFKRRNTNLLKSFADVQLFDQVILIHPSTRIGVAKAIFSNKSKKSKVQDVFVSGVFYEKLNGGLFNSLKRLFFKIQIWAQGISSFNNGANILFCYWPKGYLLNKKVALKGRIFFDTDHNIIHDENLKKEQSRHQINVLLDAGNRSELIISSARSMLNWYKENGFLNLYRLRNGIDPSRFPESIVTKKNPAPIIGYIGTLSKWIDFSVYEELIQRNPQWDFHIYGSSFKDENYRNLEKYVNVSFKGFVEAGSVPDVIKSFDVALNLYRNESWLDVDSMKIYEYLASGVPVVSMNYHPNLQEDFENLIFTADSVNEIETVILEILSGKKPNPDAREFIRENSWDKRVEEFYYTVLKRN